MSQLLTPSEELRIFRGKDYSINEHVKIHIPTLGEISDFGEDEYFSLVQQFTQTPSDLCYQLWDVGIDFTTISDYQLFSQLTLRSLSIDKTCLLFGDLDFESLIPSTKVDTGELVLFDSTGGWYIDELTFSIIADVLRDIHFLTKNHIIPANESTKMILIEDARDQVLIRQLNPSHSILINLISSMINSEGFKYNHDNVWGMKINAFMDSVYRIEKIKNANFLLQSGYSGFGVNLNEIDKKQLDWMGALR